MNAEDGNDRDLIKRISAKDRLAIEALYGRYQVRLYRFLARMTRNEAVAEELTNEVFLEVWRKAGTYAGQSTVSTWVFAIAHNKAVSLLRKRTEAQVDEDKIEELEDESDTPEVVAQKTDKAAAIKACLTRLSDDHREVIELVYYQEMSVKEVSDVVGIPQNTVKTRMFHARKQLSELMKEAGIDRGWP